MKKLLKIILGTKNFETLRDFLNKQILSYYCKKSFKKDYELFVRDATMFNKNNFNKLETHIILNYHSLEKGFLHNPLRSKFGKNKVVELLEFLNNEIVEPHLHLSQIQSALLVLKQYYDYHFENEINIEYYYSKKDYDFVLKNCKIEGKSPIIKKQFDEVFSKGSNDFKEFSKSRHSIRHYTGQLIDNERILNAIDIAKTAPSVCNRQGVKVYLVNNREKVKKLLKLQGGLAGFEENINQLLIVTGDRNYYYAIGERHQLFVDGGLFIMNLLHALHYYKIGACPAHWCYEEENDEMVRALIDIKKSEKIVTFITIGEITDNVLVTLSLRRENNEILNIIE